MGFDVRFGLGSGLRFGLGFRLRFGSGWGFCLRSSWGFGSLGRSGSVSDLVFRLGPSSGSRGLRFRSVSGSSFATRIPNIWSSKPSGVTMKFKSVTWTHTSGE